LENFEENWETNPPLLKNWGLRPEEIVGRPQKAPFKVKILGGPKKYTQISPKNYPPPQLKKNPLQKHNFFGGKPPQKTPPKGGPPTPFSGGRGVYPLKPPPKKYPIKRGPKHSSPPFMRGGRDRHGGIKKGDLFPSRIKSKYGLISRKNLSSVPF